MRFGPFTPCKKSKDSSWSSALGQISKIEEGIQGYSQEIRLKLQCSSQILLANMKEHKKQPHFRTFEIC